MGRQPGSARHGSPPGQHRDASLYDRHDRLIRPAVNVELGSHGKNLRLAASDPKPTLVVARDRCKRLAARDLDRPLATGVPDRYRGIRIEVKFRAVGELSYGLFAVRRLVGPRQPKEFTVACPPQHRCRQHERSGND
jgi:hypothetical protein